MSILQPQETPQSLSIQPMSTNPSFLSRYFHPWVLNQVFTFIYNASNAHPMSAILFWAALGLGLLPLTPLLWISVCITGFCLSIWTWSIRSQYTTKLNWSQEIVVVTGGSHGVGLELVSQLALEKKAKKVIVLDLHPCPLKVANVAYYKCDVSKLSTVRSVADRIMVEHGHPTILVNNAGVVRGKLVMDLSDLDVDLTYGVNILGQVHLIRTFLPGLLNMNRGHIVSLASVLGTVGAAQSADYCSSKFAVIGFCESLRQELKNTNVHVSYLCPGFIDSGMFMGFQHQYPWLTPTLSVPYVASQVVSVLEKNRPQVVKTPFYTNFAGLLDALLPLEVNDVCHEIMGANSAMQTFKGSLSAMKKAE